METAAQVGILKISVILARAERDKEQARVLLERYGILFRELLQNELPSGDKPAEVQLAANFAVGSRGGGHYGAAPWRFFSSYFMNLAQKCP